MNLVAFVGTDMENWGQITALMHRMECEKVVLVCSSEAGAFPASEKCISVEVVGSSPIAALKQQMIDVLKPHLGSDFEVAVSLASGTGKEHMALISALLQIPVGIRIAVYTKEGVQFLT